MGCIPYLIITTEETLKRTLTTMGLALLLANAATAADYQTCTTIKLAKDRLACFDRFAVAQTAETEAAAGEAKKAAELEATKESEDAQQRAYVLAEVDRFKAALTASFKDPGSAQFRNVVAYGRAKPLYISYLCGQVNAKNSYGAYIGFKRFFMIGKETSQVEDGKNGYIFDKMWPTTCTGEEVYRQD